MGLGSFTVALRCPDCRVSCENTEEKEINTGHGRRYEGTCPKCGKSIVWGDEARDEDRLKIIAQDISRKELKNAELWRKIKVVMRVAILTFVVLSCVMFNLSMASICFVLLGLTILPLALFCLFSTDGLFRSHNTHIIIQNVLVATAVLSYGATIATAIHYFLGADDLRSAIFQYLVQGSAGIALGFLMLDMMLSEFGSPFSREPGNVHSDDIGVIKA